MAEVQGTSTPAEVTRLSVLHTHQESVTEEATPGDEWSRESTSTSWEVYGVGIDPGGDMPADFPVAVGDVVHLVYAVYSTGDSFCSHERGRIEFFTVHADRTLAERNAEVLRAYKGEDGDLNRRGKARRRGESDPVLWTDGGASLPVHVPWGGYFESLDEVCVASFAVV